MLSLKEFSVTPYEEQTIFTVKCPESERSIGHIEKNYDRSAGVYFNACAYESANDTLIQDFPNAEQAQRFVAQHGVPV